jgi:queuine tRNA-ribosyltransferase
VAFQSHIDGSEHFFSPESVMSVERSLGADIIMAFDECPPGKADASHVARAVDRTLDWAGRCAKAHFEAAPLFNYEQALFGIVQGSTYPELRSRCARELRSIGFPGYAIGGCAVGEDISDMYSMVAFTAPLLPEDKPRYLMGVGLPADILECIERGIDMFDCVVPTRNGRNGCAFTFNGKINIRNACHTRDFDNAIDNNCQCHACRNFSRAYLRHLYMAGEILSIRMLTLHNVHFFIQLANTAREMILNNSFSEWKAGCLEKMKSNPSEKAS